MSKLNIKQIAESLAPSQETILTQICPGGTIHGKEYQAGSISGGPGKSFSFNLVTGKWADFATGEKGGDIIALYAAVNRINNAEAARTLQEQYVSAKPQHHYPVKTVVDITIIKPPSHAVKPEKPLNRGLEPTFSWTYRDTDSEPLFYIFRYDMPDGSKTFTPLSFSSNGTWVKKQWPAPRPLYNLDKLTANPNKHVLIVEGEKAADAAEQMQDIYIVTTWPGGVNAINKTDFTPLHGRKLLMWPDGDAPGIKGMSQLAGILRDQAAEIKIINPDRNSGWDAHDAFTGGMTKSNFIKWAKPLVTVIERDPVPIAYEVTVDHTPVKKIKTEVIGQTRGNDLTYRELGLTRVSEKNAALVANESNAIKLLRYMPKYSGRIWFDEFYQDLMTDHTTGEPRRWLEHDELNILYELQSNWDIPRLSLSAVKSAVKTIAFSDIRNELRDWLNSLVWDQQPRIDEFLIHAYGANDNELNRVISRNWLLSLVARGTQPGCKVDTMLVLKGLQGTFKSQSLKTLAGKYFTESNAKLDDKDFMQELAGTWIVEFDELQQFNKAEATLIKKKLSTPSDRYRPTYAAKHVNVPRTCVFVGTTNADRFSPDETGNRRFWPVDIKQGDLDYIISNREQLFAEAVYKIKQGFTWHEVPNDIFERQDSIRIEDVYEEMIDTYLSDHLSNGEIRVTTAMTDMKTNKTTYTDHYYPLNVQNIAKYALNIERSEVLNKEARKIGKAMRGLGYNSKKTRRNNSNILIFYKEPR